ncbi:MAG: Maf family protein [Proteobacteria bacterium]|nr:Maf family protein [Pseudomonadota bacterium]
MPAFILASKSQSRCDMLVRVGVPFTVDASEVDEDAIKARCLKEKKSVEEAVLELALAKAAAVGARHPGALILGADQILECENCWFDKAKTVAAAKEQLRFFSGKTHRLITAAVLLRKGKNVWQNISITRLSVRALSDDFINDYCACLGPGLLRSVGCYQFEGPGAQLFEKAEGDFFSILGLPLLPLLEVLRREGVLKR